MTRTYGSRRELSTLASGQRSRHGTCSLSEHSHSLSRVRPWTSFACRVRFRWLSWGAGTLRGSSSGGDECRAEHLDRHWNLKELMVEDARARPGRRRTAAAASYRSVLQVFDELVGHGVEIRILHASPPSRPFREELRRCARLKAGAGRRGSFELRLCPRVHRPRPSSSTAPWPIWAVRTGPELASVPRAKGAGISSWGCSAVTTCCWTKCRLSSMPSGAASPAPAASLREECPRPLGDCGRRWRSTKVRCALTCRRDSSKMQPPPGVGSPSRHPTGRSIDGGAAKGLLRRAQAVLVRRACVAAADRVPTYRTEPRAGRGVVADADTAAPPRRRT